MPLRMLIAEHSAEDVELCLAALKRAGLRVDAQVAATREEFQQAVRTGSFDVVISDHRFPGWTGFDGLADMNEMGVDIPFILVTGSMGEEGAVDAIKLGATDYVLKDRIVRLPVAVRRALDERAARARRVRAEEALRRSEARYRSLIDNSAFGIFTSTPDGHFLTVNPALVRMLGYDSPQELLALDVDRDVFADPTARRRFIARYAEAPMYRVEVEWKRKDGSAITVRLNGRAMRSESGEIASFETFAEDVTTREVIEERLRQVQKMEAMGELTGGIAHDFNNLLTIIISNAELLEPALPLEQRGELAELKAAARRGAAMIRKLLTFSRKAELAMEQVNMADAVRETTGLLRRFLPESIHLKLDAPEAAAVYADPSALEQILINLATNARDAMPSGGTLEITVSRPVLDEVQLASLGATVASGEFVCVSVRDTGIGMDERTRQRMFEPFFTTKPPHQGTGLGMAMVYGLIKQHRGLLGVYSEPGKGTTVRVYLPAAGDQRPPAAAESARSLRGGTETILVVEDEEMIRGSTRRILERLGYRVILAGDGEEALAILRERKERVHLVLSDVVMPRVSGRQLHETIRREGLDVGFMFTSGYAALDARETPTLDPSVPYLPKPWSAMELADSVRDVLDRRREKTA
jgi:PAS domain S-box-containing protein